MSTTLIEEKGQSERSDDQWKRKPIFDRHAPDGVQPSFWCLRCYDQRGHPMYAYGQGGAYDTASAYSDRGYPIGALSHRWRDARVFESGEAASTAIPLLQPWIDAYVRHSVKNEERKKGEAPFSATALQAFFERDLISIYQDGSCTAREMMTRNMATLHEEEECIRTARRFAQAHEQRLAGFSWDLSTWRTRGPQIKLSTPGFRCCRGSQITVGAMAAMWPVEWTRQKPAYPDSGYLQYDWVATLDGVTLIIDRAESTRLAPPADHGDGTRVRLEGRAA